VPRPDSAFSAAHVIEKDMHFDDWDTEQKSELESSLTAFADFLVDNFFLPCEIAFVR
jgi:hypothetical protein